MNVYWRFVVLAAAVKLLLWPAYRSTDFEVHRNWLAITHSLPINRWYLDTTSPWTLDYPPLFAYFEWLLSQVAKYVDPKMLLVDNLNYDSERTVLFQRISVIVAESTFWVAVWRCLNAFKSLKSGLPRRTTEVLLLWNVGLIFVDNIHFQYNGFLFGILLLSISFLLENRFLMSAFTFAALLNFKHIFLYMAPAFGAYYLKFYCMDRRKNRFHSFLKLALAGVVPFILSFGPFYKQLPEVLSRLFPFKRGLTHSYWAPNFWAIYNTIDKVSQVALGIPRTGVSNTAGLVQQYDHVVLPTITPLVTMLLTTLFMVPCIVKLLCYTKESDSHRVFLQSVVVCACTAFMFGWHVHEKAILMVLIPLGILSMTSPAESKHTFLLSAVGLFSLFPLLFHIDLLIIRYSLYLFYMFGLYGQICRAHNSSSVPGFHLFEWIYVLGFIGLPIYEHIISLLFKLDDKYPFLTLLLTSLYSSIGIVYFYISYYQHMLGVTYSFKAKSYPKKKSKSKMKTKTK